MALEAHVDAQVIARPALGAYSPDVLRLEKRPLGAPAEGEVLLRVLYLSLDPTNRNWLKLAPNNTVYEKIGRNLAVGDVMVGEIIGQIEESRAPGWTQGEFVGCVAEWQDRAVVPATRLRKLDVHDGEPLTVHLTIFSHIGMAAMAGIRDVGKVQPGETVLVSAAAGATGSLAVGIAKSMGCRVIGIAGGTEKCALVTGSFGADAAIDYKSEDVGEALGRLAPEGIDVYYDNVGGPILDTVLMHMANGGRVAVCGVMADYDAGEDRPGIKNMFQVLIRHLRIEGYLANHFNAKRERYFAELRGLLEKGAIHHREHLSHGLDSVPGQLELLFSGRNQGKLIVKLADAGTPRP